jgi:Fic family protein
MTTYIYDLPDWPNFRWKLEELDVALGQVRFRQGLLLGKMKALGGELQDEATLASRTEEVIKSSEIEGEKLERRQVRSSVARRLGIENREQAKFNRHVDGVVNMILDATERFEEPLTQERLLGWHASLFPTGESNWQKIQTGSWRTEPMRVISYNRNNVETLHYEAPPADRVPQEMERFLAWFNDEKIGIDPVLKAGVAHFWFETIHPFDDGNGRVGRAIMDLALARSQGMQQSFYSMSSQIRREREDYYDFLEDCQKGDLDITKHLAWFIDCLGRALDNAEILLAGVMEKARFWERFGAAPLNERQRSMIDRLMGDFEGKLTTTKWAKMTKCSQDTANRDIDQLIKLGILAKDAAGGRSTSYSLIRLSAAQG